MRPHQRIGLLLATVGLACSTLSAQQLGDPAPPLQVAEWVKGAPVELAAGKGKTIYVLYFWITGSDFGRAILPRVLELQEKYKDKPVAFVALSVEDAATLRKFLEGPGAKVRFPVGADNQAATFRAYLEPFGIKTVPHAFIVDKEGRAVWHGHPAGRLDEALDALLAGTFDLEQARRIAQAQRLLEQYIQLAKFPGKDKQARQIGEQIMATVSFDPVMMNSLAWKIVDEPGLITRDLDLALRAAEAAYKASEGKRAEIVDTYARVLFERGRKKEALEYQRKAVELAQTAELRKQLERTLRRYEKAVGEP